MFLLIIVELFEPLLVLRMVCAFLHLDLCLLPLVQNLEVLKNFVFFFDVLFVAPRFLLFFRLAFGRDLCL